MRRVAVCSLAVLLTSFGCAESSGGNGEGNVGVSETWSLESDGFICGGALLSSNTAILCERSDGRSVLTRYDLRGVRDGEGLDIPTDVLRLWRVDSGDLIVLSDDFGSV